MPINATAEYYVAEKRYLEARTKEEKIAALEEMIKRLPKHKGTDHLLSQLKKRLSRLKEEGGKKVGKKQSLKLEKLYPIVVLLGRAGSGKSSLLNALTGSNAAVSPVPYTTKEPQIGIMKYGDAFVQIVEIPSYFDGRHNSIIQMSDLVIVLLEKDSDNKEFFSKLAKDKKILFVVSKDDENKFDGVSVFSPKSIAELKSRIWSSLDVIQIYTKIPGKNKTVPSVVLQKGSKVRDFAKKIHKDFVKNFRFARIYDKTKFSGRKVGLDYVLEDRDVVEFHIS